MKHVTFPYSKYFGYYIGKVSIDSEIKLLVIECNYGKVKYSFMNEDALPKNQSEFYKSTVTRISGLSAYTTFKNPEQQKAWDEFNKKEFEIGYMDIFMGRDWHFDIDEIGPKKVYELIKRYEKKLLKNSK